MDIDLAQACVIIFSPFIDVLAGGLVAAGMIIALYWLFGYPITKA